MQIRLDLDWIKNIKTVWATWTLGVYTSKLLAEKFISSLDSSVRKQSHITFVEFGAWPGNISQEILTHKKVRSYSGTIYFHLYETLDSNVEILRGLFSKENMSSTMYPHKNKINVHIHWSAETIWTDVKDQSVDWIVSTIPVTLLPEDLLDTIFTGSRNALKYNGVFLSGQYRKNDMYDIYFWQSFFSQRPIFQENILDLIKDDRHNITDYFPPVLVTVFRKE